MFLTKKLPEGVVIGSRFYPVHTDFKNWIEISALLESDMDFGAICRILSLCYIELPENIDEALSGVLEFMKVNDTKAEKGGMEREKTFSFKADGGLIYAAFLAQYGIDLTEEGLHWHKFCTLLSGLKGEHKLLDVIFYRSVKLCEIKDKERKKFLAEMKRRYSLSDKTEEQRDIEAAQNMASLF